MEEQKVSLATAKMLDEIGFDEICNFGYSKVTNNLIEIINRNSKNIFISTPKQCLTQKFLREEYDIHIFILPYENGKFESVIHSNIFEEEDSDFDEKKYVQYI